MSTVSKLSQNRNDLENCLEIIPFPRMSHKIVSNLSLLSKNEPEDRASKFYNTIKMS